MVLVQHAIGWAEQAGLSKSEYAARPGESRGAALEADVAGTSTDQNSCLYLEPGTTDLGQHMGHGDIFPPTWEQTGINIQLAAGT